MTMFAFCRWSSFDFLTPRLLNHVQKLAVKFALFVNIYIYIYIHTYTHTHTHIYREREIIKLCIIINIKDHLITKLEWITKYPMAIDKDKGNKQHKKIKIKWVSKYVQPHCTHTHSHMIWYIRGYFNKQQSNAIKLKITYKDLPVQQPLHDYTPRRCRLTDIAGIILYSLV